MGFIQMNDPVSVLGINDADRSGFIGFGHPVNPVNFKAENIAPACIPWNGLALANVTKEMMQSA